MAQFLRAILDGEVAPCGKAAKLGLAALLFPKAEISNYASRQRREQVGETYSALEAAKLLGITRDVIYFLVRKGILTSRNRDGDRYTDLLIGKDALEEFKLNYIFPATIAKQLGTISGHLTRLLATQGIHPVSGPEVDGGRQYVFKKLDLDMMNIQGIVSIGSQRNQRNKEVRGYACRG
jgi:hypothetical protein